MSTPVLPSRPHHTPVARQATVAAVLTPGERQRVEAAGEGCFALLHSYTVPEAIRVVRERPVDAVLVSVERCEAPDLGAVQRLIREFPGVPTVALITRHGDGASERLLRLGATGVRQVVDVTSPSGWHVLRRLLAQPATRAVARIQRPVLDALPDLPGDGRLFFEALVQLSPRLVTVRGLAAVLGVEPSTLMSRFSRAGLPSPKSYLAGMRLLHASILFEDRGMSIADVAYRLEFSSPQSFGRHVRAMLGVTSSEYRRRFP
ncbi:MAG: helix-turn-helix transcriptional regulator, partial [Gemmatimonadales bacterium]